MESHTQTVQPEEDQTLNTQISSDTLADLISNEIDRVYRDDTISDGTLKKMLFFWIHILTFLNRTTDSFSPAEKQVSNHIAWLQRKLTLNDHRGDCERTVCLARRVNPLETLSQEELMAVRKHL